MEEDTDFTDSDMWLGTAVWVLVGSILIYKIGQRVIMKHMLKVAIERKKQNLAETDQSK